MHGAAEIERPSVDYEHESVFGIQKSFGYTAIRDDIVLQREWDCWCKACFDALSGPGFDRLLENNYQVATCVKKEEYSECCVQRKDARGVHARRKEAQEAGRKMVPQLQVGRWGAAQDRLNQNHTFPFLICKFMDAGSGSCIVREVEKRETVDKCRFDPGDFMLAVRWYTRDPAYPQGRTFEPAETGVLNSTELRHSGFGLADVSTTYADVSMAGGIDNLSSFSFRKSQVELDDDDDDAPLGDLLRRELYEIDSKIEQCILCKC